MIRIGVVINGQLVEEQRCSARDITVRESSRATIVAPGCGVARLQLFQRTAQGYRLVPALKAMAGNVGFAATHTAQSTAQLQLGDRGCLTLGEVTLLFQLVPVVEVAPMRLPHGLRPSLFDRFDRFDRRIVIVVATSLLFHGVLAGYALSTNVEAAPTIVGAVEQFTLQTIDVSEPDRKLLPALAATAAPPTHSSAAIPAAVATPMSEPVPLLSKLPGSGPAAVADNSARLHDQVVAMANMVTGGPGTANNHDLPQRTVGADLNKQIDAARTNQVSIGDDAQGTRNDNTLRPGTGHGPRINPDNNQTTSLQKSHEVPGRRVIPKVLSAPGGDAMPLAFAGRIANMYRTGLVRCYRGYMAGAGEAQGRVTLTLSLTASGRVASALADDFANELDRCIEGQMAQWDFKASADYDGGDAVVSLQLLPGM